MDASKLFADTAAEQGWTEATQITVLLQYIGEHGDLQGFQDYLNDRVGEETAADDSSDQPHLRVEYDLAYFGGDYGNTGDFAYIPVPLVDRCGSVEQAFRNDTGHDPVHIVHYSEDEHFDQDGDEWPDD